MLGDELVVHVAPDEAIVAKGRQPFQSRSEREALIGALECVTRISYATTLADAVAEVAPAVLVKGIDWAGKSLPMDVRDACRDYGVIVALVDTQHRTSTERLA